MEKIKTVVSIGGKDYTICGLESPEYIHRVASRVNQKMTEVKLKNNGLNNVQIAMLTSINLADDYLKSQDECAALRIEADTLRKELEQMQRVAGAKERQGSMNMQGNNRK